MLAWRGSALTLTFMTGVVDMSNLANNLSALIANTQLPVDWYSNPEIFQQEQTSLFKNAPRYMGHELMVPNLGDYYTLEWMNHAKMLVHNEHGIELLSNVCRHRQSIMLKGRGNAAHNIVCPIHRWTYDRSGTLLGAPHFQGNPCLNLGKTVLTNWKGLLFSGQRDVIAELSSSKVMEGIDFSGYVFDRMMIDDYAFNWKTFIEVYLEDYHVVPFHPGLSGFVDCDDLKWEFGEWYSAQTVGVNSRLAKPGSEVYGKWHEQVLRFDNGKLPPYGAIWVLYYPNIMIEWYPHVLVVSTILPTGPERCTNVVEFYYPEEIALFEREYVETGQAAYNETALEDAEICMRLDAGRKALALQGINEVGPYQSPMEDGMIHFHEVIRRELNLY